MSEKLGGKKEEKLKKQDLAKGKIMPSLAKLACLKISLTKLSKETSIFAIISWKKAVGKVTITYG